VTAYDEHAIRAFEANALDYLLKPVEPKRLADALQKLQLEEDKEPISDHPISVNRSILGEHDQVFVKDGERCWFVKLSDIRLFESVGNYAKVYFGVNKPLILKSLNALEERLDEKVFFRANRKHIVNLRLIEKITGQPQLGEFDGRVYRMTNSAEHAFNWHSDAFDRRAVTMSVNLSTQIYDGGGLQLKYRESEEILQEIHNTGLGDALLFRISRDLVHRVLGVKGDIPKTAFAGWFHEGEDLLPQLGKLSKPSDLAVASEKASSEVLASPKHE